MDGKADKRFKDEKKLETELTNIKVLGKRRERVLMAPDIQKNNLQLLTKQIRQMRQIQPSPPIPFLCLKIRVQQLHHLNKQLQPLPL